MTPYWSGDGVTIWHADALDIPLEDASVDLIVTSPPYFGLRSYQDTVECHQCYLMRLDGRDLRQAWPDYPAHVRDVHQQHYDGQIGSEATPAEFVDALIAATREMVRVLKPSGSIWINLGDKYSGAQAQNINGANRAGDSARTWQQTNPKNTGIPNKSLMGIPWRYALRCIDDLGLILRAEVIWSKPNGLPESVTDRVRRSHEQWFHFTKEPRYYSAVDEVREEHVRGPRPNELRGDPGGGFPKVVPNRSDFGDENSKPQSFNPLGKLPGSVWQIPTQPLRVPDHLGIDHFAAFPMEWPRRIIRGWSPRDVCSACGEGRRPVITSVALDMNRPQAKRAHALAVAGGLREEHFAALLSVGVSDTGRGAATQTGTGKNTANVYALAAEARAVLGGYAREYLLRRPTGFAYVCDCTPWHMEPRPTDRDPDNEVLIYDWHLWDPAPSTPGVVLDPFGGTGTTALVARALGRTAHHVDLSSDYCRLAQWRINDPGERARAHQVEKPPVEIDGQDDLLSLLEDGAA